MKYVVFDITDKLKNSIIGRAFITSNPIDPYRKTCLLGIIYKIQDNLPDGEMIARISNGKMYFSNGTVTNINLIGLDTEFVVFEPDITFATLGTGTCKQVILSKIKEENVADSAFLLSCKKAGPKTWTRAVFTEGCLDFGVDSTEAEVLLETPSNEKES